MTTDHTHTDIVEACADLVGRAGARGFEIRGDPMTPEMEAAAFDGLANNPTAQRYAEGRADNETRGGLLRARDAARDRCKCPGPPLCEVEHRDGDCELGTTETGFDAMMEQAEPATISTAQTVTLSDRNNAGLLAFIVRDLMDAAGYSYSPSRPFAEQARECDQAIRDLREGLVALQAEFAAANTRYDHDRQRLTDLVNELRKQLEARDRQIHLLRGELAGVTEIVLRKDAEAAELEDRIEAACPCLPGAPAHKHLTGGYTLTKDTPA